MLFLSDEKLIEQSRSQIQQETSNGFSFASIAAMTSGQVKHFYVALKIQLNKAENVLGLPLTIFDKDAAVTGKKNSNGPQHSGGSNLSWGGNTNKASPTSPSGVEKGNTSALRQRRTVGGTAAATILKKIETDDETFDAAASYRMDIQPAAMTDAKDRDNERERGVLIARSDSSSVSSMSPLQHQQQYSARVGAGASATSAYTRQPIGSPSSTTQPFEYPTARGSTAGDQSRANVSDIQVHDSSPASDGDASPSSPASRALRAPTMTGSASSSFVAAGTGMTHSNNNHGSIAQQSRRPSNNQTSGSMVSRVPAAASAAGTITGGTGVASANKPLPSAVTAAASSSSSATAGVLSSPSPSSSSLARVHYSSALLQAHTTAAVTSPTPAAATAATNSVAAPAPSAAATGIATGVSGSSSRVSPPSSPA